jgi:Zn-dependent metalloprotease
VAATRHRGNKEIPIGTAAPAPAPCRHGFIPYLTERLLQSPDVAIRERALADLSFSAELRTERRMNAAMAGLLSLQAPSEEKRRRICVASAHTTCRDSLCEAEGDPDTGDAAVDEAYHFSGDVWDFYGSLFKRRSLDGRGMTLLSTVHLAAPGGGPLDNAFWNGRQMAYGDGDGVLFNRFTCALDVIGHELTHGVQAYTCRLEYDGESGALNERFADVFGILVKQWKFGVSARTATG